MEGLSKSDELSIAIVCADPENPLALRLEKFLQKHLVQNKPKIRPTTLKRLSDNDQIRNYNFILFVHENEIDLLDAENRRLKIDFDSIDYRRKSPRGKNEILVKALGVTKGAKILDLSCGLAIDAVFLAQMGHQVFAVERNPVLFFLLQHALEKSHRPELKNLQFIFGEACDILGSSKYTKGVDAAYFDPMYPHKKKSALPRQEMLIFRELVGDDDDAVNVLKAALAVKFPRVVIKRPLRAKTLGDGVLKINWWKGHAYKGKSVRYDVIGKN